MTRGLKLGMVLAISLGPLEAMSQTPAPCTGHYFIADSSDKNSEGNLPCEVEGDPLFAESSEYYWKGSQPFPNHGSKLSRYCIYEWCSSSDTPTPAQVDDLIDTVGFFVDEDSEVISPMTCPQVDRTYLEEFSASVHRDNYRAQINALTSLPRKDALARVRVAVIDNQPKRLNSPSRNRSYIPGIPHSTEHGYTMGRLIRDLSCPGGNPTSGPQNLSCVGQINNYLALGINIDGVWERTNGFYGSLGRLGSMVMDAADQTTNQRLVINLSLGWLADSPAPGEQTPSRGPGALSHQGDEYNFSTYWANSIPDDFGYGMRFVYDVIYHANCKGALLISAAGNVSGNDGTNPGPTFPAAFEKFEYDSSECSEYLRAGETAVADVSHPLVYAVGGVDGFDTSIAMGRAEAQPRLVAPAHHFSSELAELQSCGIAKTISGTSVAAAAVSGVAAAVWGYDPTRTVSEVMDLIYSSGKELTDNADFCFEDNESLPCPSKIHRVSLCHAVQAACLPLGSNSDRCPDTLIPCGTLDPAGSPNTLDMSTFNPPTPVDSQQTESEVANASALSLEPVPMLLPKVAPQPLILICPTCAGLDMPSSYKVMVQTDKTYDDLILSTTTIDITVNGVTTTYDAPIVDGIAKSDIILDVLLPKQSGTVSSATFSTKYTDPNNSNATGALTSPIDPLP